MNEYPGLVDSHFHLLSLEAKGLDPALCLSEFFASGGRFALDVAVDVHGWDRRLLWGKTEPRLGFTAGIHPGYVSEAVASDFDLLQAQVRSPVCLAVGEIGLDWYRGREGESSQRHWFRTQLELAKEVGLPIVIHNRIADKELLEDLDSVGWRAKGIQHCFSSDKAFARACLDRGFFLGFAGNLTYKSSTLLREVAAWTPLDRILVETDAPYLSPQPVRGQTNRPLHAGITAQVLAEVRGCSVAEILAATAENFMTVMGLPPTH